MTADSDAPDAPPGTGETRDALAAVAWPIHTDRLTLRRATDSTADIEASWRIRRQPEVTEWMTRRFPELDAYAEAYREPERLASTLLYELRDPDRPGGADGTVIGDLMLKVVDAWGQRELAEQTRGVHAVLGWVIDPAHAGRGYATEAVHELIRICFRDLGLRRVTAECFADNTASWHLMERVGMRREEHAIRDSLHRSGVWLDGLRYALLAEEWQPGPAGR